MKRDKALEEMEWLIIRQQYLQATYGITNLDISNIEYYFRNNLWEYEDMKMIMDNEIKKYPIYMLNKYGKLVRIYNIKTKEDYNHYTCNLHHYILYQDYERDKNWYVSRGIQQKLILMSVPIHEQLHNKAVRNLTDEEFFQRYKIRKEELLFRK